MWRLDPIDVIAASLHYCIHTFNTKSLHLIYFFLLSRPRTNASTLLIADWALSSIYVFVFAVRFDAFTVSVRTRIWIDCIDRRWHWQICREWNKKASKAFGVIAIHPFRIGESNDSETNEKCRNNGRISNRKQTATTKTEKRMKTNAVILATRARTLSLRQHRDEMEWLNLSRLSTRKRFACIV